MAEQVILEEEDSTLPVPEEEVIEEDISLDESPDTRYNELNVNEFEQMLIEDSNRLSDINVDDETDVSEQGTSGIIGHGLQALGGVLDTIQNVGDMLTSNIEEEGPELAEEIKKINTTTDHLVFNIKGFENYDPSKPTLFFMSPEEWMEKSKKGEITHWPSVKKSEDAGQQVTRSVTNVIAGLIPAFKIVKGVKVIVAESQSPQLLKCLWPVLGKL